MSSKGQGHAELQMISIRAVCKARIVESTKLHVFLSAHSTHITLISQDLITICEDAAGYQNMNLHECSIVDN